MNESELTLRILDALQRSETGLYWRNNTGRLQDRTGRWVSYGLGVGSPDIIGILSIPACYKVIPGEYTYAKDLADLGIESVVMREAIPVSSLPGGRFVGLEVKTERYGVTPAQEAWMRAAAQAGALVAVVHSIEEALAAVKAP